MRSVPGILYTNDRGEISTPLTPSFPNSLNDSSVSIFPVVTVDWINNSYVFVRLLIENLMSGDTSIPTGCSGLR